MLKKAEVETPAVASSSEAVQQREYQEITSKLPTRSSIFLPTEKIELADRLAGIKVVREIYDVRLDTIYRPKLKALREKYEGQDRCFIIGNGPSLNQTDLSALKDEVTFAVNGFFLKAKDLDWLPTFYVVEDHLVAEDRQKWINEFKGPTKLFPVYLGYCLDEAPDTIFFNHGPRKSYPHGFDFSTNANEVTYAGCTVTYTCMQLAFYMGFKEIYLIGVDASYDLPTDVQKSDTYGVGVLDMKSADPNHFHPDYFGKGFRWHDPQVNKMLEAYQEARRVTERTSRRIYNATVGGKLEIFERRSFQSIFPHAKAPEQLEQAALENREPAGVPPRLLVLDLTAKGDGTATGELKANMFRAWPQESYLQLFSKGRDSVGLVGKDIDTRSFKQDEFGALQAVIRDFDPEVILYRPVPDAPSLHGAAMQVIETFADVPLATWIMDDWPLRLQADDTAQFEELNRDWLWLLDRSALRLSISDRMSEAFKKRYGYQFHAFANGVDPADWPEKKSAAGVEFVIRYAGALADNMTARSIQRVAEAVEELARNRTKVRLEIKTQPVWKKAQAKNFRGMKHTKFFTEDLSTEEYRAWLRGADAVLIAYNFDADSLRYIGLSMANKLPECLASGAPLVAHGPREAATIDYLKQTNCALVLDDPEAHAVRQGIEKLVRDGALQKELAARARDVAFSNHDIRAIRNRLAAVLGDVAKQAGKANTMYGSQEETESTAGYSREEKATVDETEVVSHMLRARTGRAHVMLDVGAHFGTSAAYFDALGWTIHCFEPDPNNRNKLVQRFGKKSNVSIDARAVSDKPAIGVAFFTSDESTGISGLHAFRETHREHGQVDVTTIAEIVEARGLTHIDFLKIDVEGFDFSVLKGSPWDKLCPDVIECEFENLKTVPLGHTYKDVAQYLHDKGYSVYLSEWHPILRYGIRHDWRRLVRFPGTELRSDAWGNILAFREDPGFDAVMSAFDEVVAGRRGAVPTGGGESDIGQTKATGAQGSGPAGLTTTSSELDKSMRKNAIGMLHRMTALSSTSGYERLVRWSMNRSPIIYRAGQFTMWCARVARDEMVAATAFAVTLVALAVGGFVLPPPVWPILSLGIAAVLLVVAALAAIIGFAGHLFRRSLNELQLKLAAQERQLRSLDHRSEKVRQNAELNAERNVAAQASTDRNVAKLKHLAKSASVFNATHFQHFDRILGEADIETLISQWAKPLGLELTKARLGYLAHRACLLESQMKGRLATSVETIVLRSLVASALKRSDISILEIGTLFGVGAAALYEAASNEFDTVHVTVIDPLDGYYSSGNRDILTGARVSEATLRQNWSLAPIPQEDFTIIKHLSSDPEAMKAAARREYDVLIIDGDHSYDGVKFDFDHYSGMVRPGGYIIFDDYDVQNWPDIKRYVDTEIEGLPHLNRTGASFRTAVYQVEEKASEMSKTKKGRNRG